MWKDGKKISIGNLIGGHNCPDLHGVFLNACDSESLKGPLLANGASFVIVCNQPVGDRAAKVFAEQFYKHLFMGSSVHDAFEAGRYQLSDVEGLALHAQTMELHVKETMQTLVDRQCAFSTQADLARLLEPRTFSGRINRLVAAYCEGTRTWVFEKVAEWMEEHLQSATGVFVVIADMGIGKSCISAKLTQGFSEFPEFVYGHYFYAHDEQDSANPKQLITTWAHQLSERIPEYGDELLKLLHEQGLTKQTIRDKSVADLFSLLLSEPLSSKRLHKMWTPPTQPIALLVDALDECEHQGRNELLRLICTRWCELPSWMRLIVTTRPTGGTEQVNDIVTQLNKYKLFKLDASDKRNLDDIELFAQRLLVDRVIKAEMVDAVETLKRKSDGRFLYLQYAKETCLSQITGTVSAQQLLELPNGMKQLYGYEFGRIDAALAKSDESQTQKWTPVQVANWMKQIRGGRLAHYAQLILDENVTGADMQKMTKDDLQDLGVDNGVARTQINTTWFDPSAGVLQQCLEVVVAAVEPLPMNNVAEIVGCSDIEVKKVLRGLGIFFPERDGFITVWHKSVRDWLTDLDRKGQQYWVDETEGHKFLASAATKVIQEEVKTKVVERRAMRDSASIATDGEVVGSTANDDSWACKMQQKGEQLSVWALWCLRHVVEHTALAGRDSTGLICDLRYVESKAEGGMAFDLVKEYGSLLRGSSGGSLARYFYRFALEFRTTLNMRPHLVLQCAANWPDGLPPTTQAAKQMGEEYEWLRLQQKPSKLRALIQTMNHASASLSAGEGCSSGMVTSVCFSPSGDCIVSGSSNGILKVWDAASGREQASMKHGGERIRGVEKGVTNVKFSPRGDRIVSGSSNGTLKVWDVVSGEEQARMAHDTTCDIVSETGVTSVCFSPTRNHVASGGNDGNIKFWDVELASEFVRPIVHGVLLAPNDEGRGTRRGVSSVCFSRGGDRMVSGGNDGNIRVWIVASGEEQICIQHSQQSACSVMSACFSSCGNRILSNARCYRISQRGVWDLTDQGSTKVWDILSRKETTTIMHTASSYHTRVCCVCFSAKDDCIVTGSSRGTITVWDTVLGKEQACMSHAADGVRSLCFSPTGKWIVSGGADGKLNMWDADSFSWEAQKFDQDRLLVWSVHFSQTGNYVVSGGDNGEVKLWDLSSGEEQACMMHGNERIKSVCVSPGGDRVVSGSCDGTLRIWAINIGIDRVELITGWNATCKDMGDRDEQASLELALKESQIEASRSQEAEVCLSHGNEVWSVAFSPSGDRIVSGDQDGTVKVWNAASGEELACTDGSIMDHGAHDGYSGVTSVCFSPCGASILSGGMEGRVLMWDATTGEEKTYMDHGGEGVDIVCFSEDGERILSYGASGHFDVDVKEWDAASGNELSSIETQESARRRVLSTRDCSCWSLPGFRLEKRRFSIQLYARGTMGGETEIASICFDTAIQSASFLPPTEGSNRAVFILFECANPQVVHLERGKM
jgi:WD40 repeat protein